MAVEQDFVYKGDPYKLRWIEDSDFSKLDNVKQVYGFLFDQEGKVVVITDNPEKNWTLPGGSPEDYDKDWMDTLIREVEEEADVEIDENSVVSLGYVEVKPMSEKCRKKTHYQLRVAAKVSKIKEQTTDPARNMINYRKFIKSNEFLDHCPWGNVGEAQLKKALEKFNQNN